MTNSAYEYKYNYSNKIRKRKMTNEQIKDLETQLWDAADNLRANSKLTAAEYKDPVLGLILLRFAQNRFEDAKKKILSFNDKLPDGLSIKEINQTVFKTLEKKYKD